jgi:hypothetical protein
MKAAIGDHRPAGGPIHVRDMSLERLLVISDVLAKSVVLADPLVDRDRSLPN